MSVKKVFQKKMTMAAYDSAKLGRQAEKLFKSVKEIEKTLNEIGKKK